MARNRMSLVRDAKSIVFVCSGNVVRSAFAELYARHLDCPRPVRSIATMFRNDRIFPETVGALRRIGVREAWIDSFRPTHLEDWMEAGSAQPVYLAMSEAHLDALARWPAARTRAMLLDDPREIADPVMEGASFGATFERVASCVRELVRELERGGTDSRVDIRGRA